MRRRPRPQFPLLPRMPCHRLPQRLLLRRLSHNRIDARVILFHALPFSVLVFSMLPRCVLVSSNEPRERNSRAELRTPRVRWLVRGNYRGADIGGIVRRRGIVFAVTGSGKAIGRQREFGDEQFDDFGGAGGG